MNRDKRRLHEARQKMVQQSRLREKFQPGTCFRVKMRRRDSKEVHGKKYRCYIVNREVNGMFLCTSLEETFQESFSLWDLGHMAEIITKENYTNEEEMNREGTKNRTIERKEKI